MFDTPSADSLILTQPHAQREWLQPVWTLLDQAYRQVAGGLHYTTPEAMLEETPVWELLLDEGRLQAALLYKRKHGLKIVALGVSDDEARRPMAVARLGQVISDRLHQAWIEVSERAECFVLRHGGESRRIRNHHAARLTGKPLLSLHADGYHYVREIQGLRKLKLIVGTPAWT